MNKPTDRPEQEFDLVEEADLESFPASDAPAWSGGREPTRSAATPAPSGIVAGIFSDETQAGNAFEALVEAHFDPLREISIIAAHRREHEEVPIAEHFEMGKAAEIVGGLGAILVGAGAALVSLGVVSGPVGLLASGPVLAALQGAYAGGAAGVATGALAGLGIWHDEAEFHASHIHEGAFWVGVHATGERAVMARKILQGAGARHFQGGGA